MITPNEIRSGVDDQRKAWVSLRYEGEVKCRPDEDPQKCIELMRHSLMDKIYGDANQAVNEMEYLVMSSVGLGDRDRITEMFKRLRSTIAMR